MAEEKKPSTVKVGDVLAKDKKEPKSEPKAESKSKKKKHRVHKMEIRRAGDGYITVHHSKDDLGQMMEPEENAHTDLDTVHDAVEEHMGAPNAGEEAEEAAEAGQQPAAQGA